MDNFTVNLEEHVKRVNYSSVAAYVKVSDPELIFFANQLSIMIESGVILSEALEAIALQTKAGAFKAILEEITEKIKTGQSFSDSLAAYPGVFSSMFVSMVRASELSGKMSEMLDVLSQYLNAESETKKQIKGAMIYPLIMLLMSIAATGSLMFFVLPRFTKIYESRGADLPGLTQVLVNCSQIFGNPQSMAIIVTCSLMIGFGFHYWRTTPSGRLLVDTAMVRMPVIGTMYVDAVVTRYMRILSTMVNTGVSLLDALGVIKISCDNVYFKQLWESVDKKIRDGYQFSDAISISKGSELIAPGVMQMLRAGEKSGKLGHVCDRISVFYEKKLTNSVKLVTALIEPVMITIMGFVIGTIAIALLLPVFRISSVMSH